MSDKKTILVIDDIHVNTVLLTRMLETTSYHAISAESGKMALEIMKTNHIDLVLLDLMMPVMNGYEVLKAIRNSDDFGDVPVIITTALSDDKSEEKARSLGANGYMVKPINRDALLATIAKFL